MPDNPLKNILADTQARRVTKNQNQSTNMWSAPACIINMAWVERPLVGLQYSGSDICWCQERCCIDNLHTHTGGSPPKPAVFEETTMSGLFFQTNHVF